MLLSLRSGGDIDVVAVDVVVAVVVVGVPFLVVVEAKNQTSRCQHTKPAIYSRQCPKYMVRISTPSCDVFVTTYK